MFIEWLGPILEWLTEGANWEMRQGECTVWFPIP
jgi:hypothetical protein